MIAVPDLSHDLGAGEISACHPDEASDQRVILDDEHPREGGRGHVNRQISIPAPKPTRPVGARLSREKGVAVSHVFVVDGHGVILEAVRLLCSEHGGLSYAGGASSVPEAIPALAHVRVDVLMIDLGLSDSLGLVRTARARWPGAAILVVHDRGPANRIRKALALGAVGVVDKSAEITELLGAIRRAASGGPRTLGAVSPPPGLAEGMPSLSARERAVLRLLAHGQSNAEIAAELGISPRTVASHVASVYRRLQVETRVDAAAEAMRLGITSGPEGQADLPPDT
jgi:DNA-binding NarL/FixJ family response regulator